MSRVDDEEILKERGTRYGPMEPMWMTIGKIQWANFMFLMSKCSDAGRDPTDSEMAHLACMNMEAVKMVRSIYDPTYEDNFVDGRNYWTIAERVSND